MILVLSYPKQKNASFTRRFFDTNLWAFRMLKGLSNRAMGWYRHGESNSDYQVEILKKSIAHCIENLNPLITDIKRWFTAIPIVRQMA